MGDRNLTFKLNIYKYCKKLFKIALHNFSDEIFTVHDVLLNLPTPRYILKEWNGDIVQDGTFFPNELSKVLTREDRTWNIDQVLKTKGNFFLFLV